MFQILIAKNQVRSGSLSHHKKFRPETSAKAAFKIIMDFYSTTT